MRSHLCNYRLNQSCCSWFDFITQCSVLSTMLMPSLLKYILLSLAVLCSCAKSIPVLTMDPNIRPEDNATVEILDTKIINTLDKMTICGRFRTPYLPFMLNHFQNLVYIKDMWLLYMLDLRNCERTFKGCTKYYQDQLGNF